jgi:predicted permease
MHTDGTATRGRRLSLGLRVRTSLIDALWERKETMTMNGLWNEVRIALRSLARSPAFTFIAVLTLALGIGVNTAVFTLVDGVLLRPLPFPEADELLSIRHQGRDGQDQLPLSPGLYFLYREQSRTLDDVAMYATSSANLVVDGEPERILGQTVTPDFFRVLDVEAARGRTFLEEEMDPGASPVMILSDGLWRSHFGADPEIIGRTVDTGGTLREVVGVMPAGFGYPDDTARFWMAMTLDRDQSPIAAFSANGIARMADGVSQEGAEAEIAGMLGTLDQIFPESPGASFLMDVGISARIAPLKEYLVGDLTTTLWILLGTVGFVLLIAAANVANLLLVRAEGRQREMALRVAVGAGRGDVLKTFMGESLILATSGVALGLLVAWVAIEVTEGFIPESLPRMAEVGMNLRVLGFTAAIGAGCAVFFGLFPLVRYGADDLAGQLKEGAARGSTGGGPSHRLRNGLVVTQVALAMVLLVGSGLMLRSFMALRAVDPGFDTVGILTARFTVPTGEVEDPREVAAFYRALQERLAAQPGVEAAGLVTSVPLGGGGNSFGGLEVEDHPRGPDELPIFAALPQIGPGAVEALGIEVLEGRSLQPGDAGDGLRGALVSRAFAEAWWPEGSPVGRRVRFGGPDQDWHQIVGVVDDVRSQGLATPPQETVYFPSLVEAGGQYFIPRGQDVVVRVAGDPLAFLPILRRELQALNPRIPLSNPRTMSEVFRGATARTSFTMSLLGAASGIALILGLVGIYGVISYIVSQRTREIGVRMALGASAGSVRGMVVRHGVVLSLGGVALGLGAAALLSRVMASLLYGVEAVDPLTYATVGASLVAVATLASWLPALRAAGVDPSKALRAD